jgi:ParB-like chromosome segregation protein Spo0J
MRNILREESLELLMDSIREIGLQTPISVKRDDLPTGYDFEESYLLVAGAHRLEACRRLGKETIEAVVTTLNDFDRKIWEIDENLIRADLTVLEQSEHIAARKEIYEQKHPQTRRGGAIAANAEMGRKINGLDATDKLSVASFTADTASKTGLDERTVQRSIQRAAKIAAPVRDMIRDIPDIADSGVELDALAKIKDEKEQKKIVQSVLSGEHKNVREAIKTKNSTKGKPSGNRKCRVSDTALQKWAAQFIKWDLGSQDKALALIGATRAV